MRSESAHVLACWCIHDLARDHTNAAERRDGVRKVVVRLLDEHHVLRLVVLARHPLDHRRTKRTLNAQKIHLDLEVDVVKQRHGLFESFGDRFALLVAVHDVQRAGLLVRAHVQDRLVDDRQIWVLAEEEHRWLVDLLDEARDGLAATRASAQRIRFFLLGLRQDVVAMVVATRWTDALQAVQADAQDERALKHQVHKREHRQEVKRKVRQHGWIAQEVAQKCRDHHSNTQNAAPPWRTHGALEVGALELEEHAAGAKQRHQAQERVRVHARQRLGVSVEDQHETGRHEEVADDDEVVRVTERVHVQQETWEHAVTGETADKTDEPNVRRQDGTREHDERVERDKGLHVVSSDSEPHLRQHGVLVGNDAVWSRQWENAERQERNEWVEDGHAPPHVLHTQRKAHKSAYGLDPASTASAMQAMDTYTKSLWEHTIGLFFDKLGRRFKT